MPLRGFAAFGVAASLICETPRCLRVFHHALRQNSHNIVFLNRHSLRLMVMGVTATGGGGSRGAVATPEAHCLLRPQVAVQQVYSGSI
jgi:hypothetical protein